MNPKRKKGYVVVKGIVSRDEYFCVKVLKIKLWRLCRWVLKFMMVLVENYLKVLLASMKTVVCKKLYLGEPPSEAVFKQKHGEWGPNAGVDNNLTLCRLQSRLQDIYYGQPYVRVDFIPPVRD
jgi:hypothetical protein